MTINRFSLPSWLRRLFRRPPPVQRSTSLLSPLDYIQVRRDSTIEIRDLAEDEMGLPAPPPRLSVWDERRLRRDRYRW